MINTFVIKQNQDAILHESKIFDSIVLSSVFVIYLMLILPAKVVI